MSQIPLVPHSLGRIGAHLCIGLLLLVTEWASASVDKRDYVTEAFRSMPAYFDFLAQQRDFLVEMPPELQRQFRGIHLILQEHVYSAFPSLPGDSSAQALQVGFSDRAEDFLLNPGEPERSAKTTSERESPILFNLRKLNQEKLHYLDVVQLFVHELGHKLGIKKNQTAVDQLSERIRSYLEAFYMERDIPGHFKASILSLPFEFKPVRAMGESDLRQPNIFIEAGQKADSVDFDLGGYVARASLGNYTASPQGSGNFMLQQAFRLVNVEANRSGRKVLLELSLEVQNRLVFHSPEARLVPGPIIGKGQILTPVAQEYDLIPPETHLTKIPVSVYKNFMSEYEFQPDNFATFPWTYSRSNRNLSIDGAYIIESTPAKILAEVKIRGSQDERPGTVALEITSVDGKHSHLVTGELHSAEQEGTTYRFEIPRSTLPSEGILERVIFDQAESMELPEILRLPSPRENGGAPPSDELPLRMGSIEIITDQSTIPYSRTEKIVLDSGPIRLRIPVNFEPQQIRLRWLKGIEISLSGDEDRPLGRHSRVVEEVFNAGDTLALKNVESQWVELESREVHRSAEVSFLIPKSFQQQDKGLRELKEIILVSNDGRTLSMVLSSNRKIYNDEHLKVSLARSCQSLFR